MGFEFTVFLPQRYPQSRSARLARLFSGPFTPQFGAVPAVPSPTMPGQCQISLPSLPRKGVRFLFGFHKFKLHFGCEGNIVRDGEKALERRTAYDSHDEELGNEPVPRELLMIISIDIDNFRGFRQVGLQGLKRVNILVGPNASGKTGFLEAVFLALARSPEVAFRFRRWRGLMGEFLQVTSAPATLGVLWTDLFWNVVNDVSIVTHDSNGEERSCRVHYEPERSSSTLPIGEQAGARSFTLPIQFEWVRDGRTFTVPVELKDGQLNLGSIAPVPFETVFLSSGIMSNPAETAAWYSALSQENKEAGVLAAVKKVYPFVKGLTVEVGPGGDGAAVHATISGVSKKLPVHMLSGGINKYLTVLLSMSFAQGGVILIDEIENGLYFDSYRNIWSGVVSEANTRGSQLFVTTHSAEFLRAASSLVEKNPGEFCLLRARRLEDGSCALTRVEGRDMAAALQEDFEVR